MQTQKHIPIEDRTIYLSNTRIPYRRLALRRRISPAADSRRRRTVVHFTFLLNPRGGELGGFEFLLAFCADHFESFLWMIWTGADVGSIYMESYVACHFGDMLIKPMKRALPGLV